VPRRRARAHACSVLGDEVERQQALAEQRREYVGEEPIERFAMPDSKLAEPRVAHGLVADDPLEGLVAPR